MLGDEVKVFVSCPIKFLVLGRGLINVMIPPSLPVFFLCKCSVSFDLGCSSAL